MAQAVTFGLGFTLGLITTVGLAIALAWLVGEVDKSERQTEDREGT